MRYARVHEREKNAWRTSSKKREREREKWRENRRDGKGRRAKIGREGCGSGPPIISGDWPMGPTTGGPGWTNGPRSVHQVRKTHPREKPCLRARTAWEW